MTVIHSDSNWHMASLSVQCIQYILCPFYFVISKIYQFYLFAVEMMNTCHDSLSATENDIRGEDGHRGQQSGIT